MKIDETQLSDLVEAFEGIQENLNNFKKICKQVMDSHEYERFKYNILGHIEPHILNDTDWATFKTMTSTLEDVVSEAEGMVGVEDTEEQL